MASSKKACAPKDPPLEREQFTETDAELGVPVTVTRLRRGVLRSETRQCNDLRALRALCINPREETEAICEGLRALLEERGLPSDRTPSWIRRGDGEWRPASADDKLDKFSPEELKIGVSLKRWTKRVEDLAEPLSAPRYAAELLDLLTHLLTREGIDEHLWHINRAMVKFSLFKIAAGGINQLASQAIVMRRARAAGPAARTKKGDQVREVIWSHATAYWLTRPSFRGDAANTAECIQSDVNKELADRKLLFRNSNGLRPKTIADHISKAMREKNFQIGQ